MYYWWITLIVLIIIFAVFFLLVYKNNTKYVAKNHDHLKVKYTTKSSAEKEMNRMKLLGYPGSERLNVYQNKQNGYWYVGKSKEKKEKKDKKK